VALLGLQLKLVTDHQDYIIFVGKDCHPSTHERTRLASNGEGEVSGNVIEE